MLKSFRISAAWRISIWPTLAFATGTAVAFLIVYFLVGKSIRDRTDTWLSGEVETLARVAADTPRDYLYNRILGEVAELATQEAPHERNAEGQKLNSVFFLEVDSRRPDERLWIGPGSPDAFLDAIQQAKLNPGVPQTIRVAAQRPAFRVIVRQQADGRRIYLGLSVRADNHLLHRFSRGFVMIWVGTVLLGFLVSYWSARRTLLRVERIAETVAGIGAGELEERLPEPVNSDEISRLAQTFNHMLDRIQSSVNQLRSVTDSIAHDLKSPITLIRGTLEAALCREDDVSWRESVGQSVEDLDGLLLLLNTTLDLAEAEAGALRLNRIPVDLSAALAQLASLYQPAMAERGHVLTLDLEPQVLIYADPLLLNRVISNLLHNELTHLPPGCLIGVHLRAYEGSAILLIEDNGPGFPSGLRTRAFERFVKGENSPGHGLGLAFVAAVVRAHAGTIRLSDRPGGGAVITVSFPISVLQTA
jgi:signal transduction histidine kinase